MDVQNWKDPAPRASAGAAKVVADALRAEPGKWAIIEEFLFPIAEDGASAADIEKVSVRARQVRAKASSKASLIKQGRVAAFRSLKEGWPGTFEAVSRSETNDDTDMKVIRVYARYRGEEFAQEAPPKSTKAKPASDGSGPVEAPASDEVSAPVEDDVFA